MPKLYIGVDKKVKFSFKNAIFLDVHCKIQTRPLVKEGTQHEKGSIFQTEEHVKSGHGPQRAARHQDTGRLTVGRKFNSTPLSIGENRKEFNRTVRISSRFKAVRVGSSGA
jgi:hypothetical protein